MLNFSFYRHSQGFYFIRQAHLWHVTTFYENIFNLLMLCLLDVLILEYYLIIQFDSVVHVMVIRIQENLFKV